MYFLNQSTKAPATLAPTKPTKTVKLAALTNKSITDKSLPGRDCLTTSRLLPLDKKFLIIPKPVTATARPVIISVTWLKNSLSLINFGILSPL